MPAYRAGLPPAAPRAVPAREAAPAQTQTQAQAPGAAQRCPLTRPLRALPPELRDKYPMIVAVSESHWVHRLDDIVRRHVPEYVHGEFVRGSDNHLYSADMLQRFAEPAAGPPASATQLAYYHYDESTKELVYYFEGKPVASLLPDIPLYPLGPGKFMVGQPYGKCHLLAAIQAMMAQGKSEQNAAAQLRACRWDTPIEHAEALHTYLRALAYAEHRPVATRSGTDRDWFYVGIYLVEDMMAKFGGPCLFLCGGQAVIIHEIAYAPIDPQDPLRKVWSIRLSQIRTCTYMVIDHPKEIFTALQELAPARDSTRAPGFASLRQTFGVMNWDAFCVSTTPGLPLPPPRA